MIDFIGDIIDHSGPRLAGSAAEKKAQEMVAGKCRSFTDSVALIEFEEYLNARFGKLKYYSLFFFLSLGLYLLSPVAAFVVSLLSAAAFVLDFTAYRTVLGSFPGPLMKSWHVSATLEPEEEAKSTLLFSGHIDSVMEFKWWYKLGQTGATLTVIAGVLMALLPLYLLVLLLLPTHSPAEYGLLVFALLSPSLMVYFNLHGDVAVDGACDNLSGVAVAYAVVKHFAHPERKGYSTLKHTRLRFVSFGSEEPGLIGSLWFSGKYAEELKQQNTHVVNIDSIRIPEELCVIEKELMSLTNHDKALAKKVKAAYDASNIPAKTGTTPIGGTDAVGFTRKGIPAVSIIGLGMDKLDPTYHTRRDTLDNLSQQALDNARNGLLKFVEEWDKE